MGNRTNPIYHFLSSSVSSPQKIFLIPLKNGSSVSPHGSEEAKKEMSKKQVEQRTKERRGENWTSQDRPARPSLPRVAASALAGAPLRRRIRERRRLDSPPSYLLLPSVAMAAATWCEGAAAALDPPPCNIPKIRPNKSPAKNIIFQNLFRR